MEKETKWWLGVGVESSVAWPTVDTKVTFEGRNVILRAATDTTTTSVDLEYESPMTATDAHLLLRRFLTSLAWAEGKAVRETFSLAGSKRLGFGVDATAVIYTSNFRADYLPESTDPKIKLALALYREALGLNSLPYKFLGFFKILNVVYSTSRQQKDWITISLPSITDYRPAKRIQELQKSQDDVAAYLYGSGRCAVAHAFDDPVVDPDKFEDNERLSLDLPVIQALAEHLIEYKLGVKSHRTIRREHLYELDGFRHILGSGVVETLKKGGKPDRNALPDFHMLSIRIRDHESFPSLESLMPQNVEFYEGHLVVVLHASDTSMRVSLTLDFENERLAFDPIEDIVIEDDGSTAVIRAAIDQNRFISRLLANGQLEVWQASPEILLGRCNPYIPENIDPIQTDRDIQMRIASLEAEIERRSDTAPK